MLLARNTGKGFVDVSAQSGDIFHQAWAARGLAIGDIDNDGRIDLEQQLMLLGVEPGSCGRLFAEVQKPSKRVAKLRQCLKSSEVCRFYIFSHKLKYRITMCINIDKGPLR